MARTPGVINSPQMKTRAELRAEYDHLFEAEDYEASGKVLDLIEPISDEEWLKIVHNAPPEDEELPRKRSNFYAG